MSSLSFRLLSRIFLRSNEVEVGVGVVNHDKVNYPIMPKYSKQKSHYPLKTEGMLFFHLEHVPPRISEDI